MEFDAMPVLDLQAPDFAEQFQHAYRDSGFADLTNHGISPAFSPLNFGAFLRHELGDAYDHHKEQNT